MYKIFFEPKKKWWEFWKRNRYLVNGKDYEIVNGRFVCKKVLNGKIDVRLGLSDDSKSINI